MKIFGKMECRSYNNMTGKRIHCALMKIISDLLSRHSFLLHLTCQQHPLSPSRHHFVSATKNSPRQKVIMDQHPSQTTQRLPLHILPKPLSFHPPLLQLFFVDAHRLSSVQLYNDIPCALVCLFLFGGMRQPFFDSRK